MEYNHHFAKVHVTLVAISHYFVTCPRRSRELLWRQRATKPSAEAKRIARPFRRDSVNNELSGKCYFYEGSQRSLTENVILEIEFFSVWTVKSSLDTDIVLRISHYSTLPRDGSTRRHPRVVEFNEQPAITRLIVSSPVTCLGDRLTDHTKTKTKRWSMYMLMIHQYETQSYSQVDWEMQI